MRHTRGVLKKQKVEKPIVVEKNLEDYWAEEFPVYWKSNPQIGDWTPTKYLAKYDLSEIHAIGLEEGDKPSYSFVIDTVERKIVDIFHIHEMAETMVNKLNSEHPGRFILFVVESEDFCGDYGGKPLPKFEVAK
jgi:hypothetical protein